jgi:hypothetical protein
VVVCAAGNSAKNIDTSPFYPASYTSPQVIAVAASTSTDTLATFSNYGTNSVDVAAPGEYIYSTLRSSSYGYMSGTSMATPHVAGLAGLLKAYSPESTCGEVKAAILGGVDRKTSLNGKVLTSGRINAYTALGLLRPVSLSVTGITPGSAPNSSPIVVTISGTGFTSTPRVNLTGPGVIPATEVIFVSPINLTAKFDLTGKSIGFYTLMVTNPDSDMVTWPDCFKIVPPPDSTPPGPVTELHNTTYVQTAITWTWTDPNDSDFDHVMVYMDSVLRANITKGVQNYTSTGLAAGTDHTIGIRTVDSAGNANPVMQIHTAATAPAPGL